MADGNNGEKKHFDAFSGGNSEQRNFLPVVSYRVAAGLLGSTRAIPIAFSSRIFQTTFHRLFFAPSYIAKQSCLWFGFFFPVSLNLVYNLQLTFMHIFIISIQPS